MDALLLDIGGVLEHTPATGWERTWERRLGLSPGGLMDRIGAVLEPGELGLVTHGEVVGQVAAALDLDPAEREEVAYGFSRHVDVIVYSHEEGLKKPDPAFYRLASKPPRVLRSRWRARTRRRASPRSTAP